MAKKCNWFQRLWHRFQRREDRCAFVLPRIRIYPNPWERAEAWQRLMAMSDMGYWRCECAQKAWHPILPWSIDRTIPRHPKD